MSHLRTPARTKPGKTRFLQLAERITQQINKGPLDLPSCQDIRLALGDHAHSVGAIEAAQAEAFDKIGTELWNTTGRNSENVIDTLPLLRCLAFKLLEAAYKGLTVKNEKRRDSTIRLFRVSLDTARCCLDKNELDLGLNTLTKAADLARDITIHESRTDAQTTDPTRQMNLDLVSEYWLLRAALSWKQDRLDLVESHLRVATNPGISVDSREKLADLQYEVAKSLHKIHPSQAISWYEKAGNTLEQISTEDSSSDVLDLKASITRDLVRALLSTSEEQAVARAADLIEFLEQEYGAKLGVSLLKFDLLAQQRPVVAADYQKILLHVIQIGSLSENTFQIILHHTRELNGMEPALAVQVLETLLRNRLYDHGDPSYIDKAAVAMTWICAAHVSSDELATSLNEALNGLQSHTHTALGENAAYAIQSLLWKAIDLATSEGDSAMAEKWCRLAMHSALDSAGDINKTKICRKIISIALSRGDVVTAGEVFTTMPSAGRDEPASQFLHYRIALRNGDEELTQQCLGRLMNVPAAEAGYLFACAQEAMQLGTRQNAIRALRAVLQRHQTTSLAGIRSLTLTRCMIQSLLQNIKDSIGNTSEQLGDICKLLKSASSTQVSLADGPISLDELQWFSKTSFNTAVHFMPEAEPSTTIQLSEACLGFCDGDERLPTDEVKHMIRRKGFCHFMAAASYVAQARASDHLETFAQHYTSTSKHTSAFFDILNNNPPSINASTEMSLASKRPEMIRFEVEALLRLKQWERLDASLARCAQSIGSERLDLLADLIITTQAVMREHAVDPRLQQHIPNVMQAIINQSWRAQGSQDMSKLARWLRCTFRMTMGSSPDMALRIVEQVADIVSKRQRSIAAQRYPSAEAEWMASTTFNSAVDRYCAADMDGCRAWAGAALNLAKVAVDCPGLYAQMQGLWTKLQAQMDAIGAA